MRQTTIVKKKEVKTKWYVVDATGQVLGRLSAFLAFRLRGKHKADFTPNTNCGDKIIVINSEKIVLTGRKEARKKYYLHSRYPGGLKTFSAKFLRKKNASTLIEKAVKGMIPNTVLGRLQLKNLRVFTGANHPMSAQKPEKLAVK